MTSYNQMRVNPVPSKPPKPKRPKDPPARTQKDEFIIEGSEKSGKSGKGLSTQEVMDIADIAVKLFNSKKYPTLYDDATLRERNRTEGAPALRMSFQPTYDGVELAIDIASNPTPVGIGIAVAKQLLKLDIMGEVEAQIANTRQIQLHEEDRHRDIASAEEKKREIEIHRLQSKHKVVFGDLQKRLSSSLSVRTNTKVEVPKVTYENLEMYLDPPKIFKEADNVKTNILKGQSKLKEPKFPHTQITIKLFTDDGHLKESVIELLKNAFLYDATPLKESIWQHYSSSKRGELWFKMTQMPNASVSGKYVYFETDQIRESFNSWINLIAHEESHHHDIYKSSNVTFYLQYLIEGLFKKYENISTEKKAFLMGAGNMNSLADDLLKFQNGAVEKIFFGNLSEKEKIKAVIKLSLEFRMSKLEEILSNYIKNDKDIKDKLKSTSLNSDELNFYKNQLKFINQFSEIVKNEIKRLKKKLTML